MGSQSNFLGFLYHTAPLIFGFFQSGELEEFAVFFSYEDPVIVPKVPVIKEMNLHFTNLKVSSLLPWKPCSILELYL